MKEYKNKIIDMLNDEKSFNYRVWFQSLYNYKKLKEIIKKIRFDYFKDNDNWIEFLFDLPCSCYYYTKQIQIEPKKVENKTTEDACLEITRNIINQRRMKFEFVNKICSEVFCNKESIKSELKEYIRQEELKKKEKMLYKLHQEYYLMEDD